MSKRTIEKKMQNLLDNAAIAEALGDHKTASEAFAKAVQWEITLRTCHARLAA